MKEELLYRYLSGETTEAENEQILMWLDQDPEAHIKELNRIRYICQAVQHAPQQALPGRPFLSLHRWSVRLAGMAALVALVVGVWHAGQWRSQRAIADRMSVVEVPAGQYIRLTLEDGTSVWLNASSRLEYPVLFTGKERRVRISGEALFEVERDEKRPFIVETFASEIEVLGTKFDVCADERHDRFSATLLEGRVKVTNLCNPAERMLMEPHDVVNLVYGRLYKSSTPNFPELCWTEGLLYLRQMPFDELMIQFERTFGVDIVLRRQSLPHIDIISGELRVSDGVENAMRLLQQMSDFTYEYDHAANTIYIK